MAPTEGKEDLKGHDSKAKMIGLKGRQHYKKGEKKNVDGGCQQG
jgi:hypothetical protein